MGVVDGDIGCVEPFDHSEPLHDGRPASTAVDRFVYAASGHREVEVGGIAWVDEDRVQFRSIRRAVLYAAHPLAVLWIVVDVRERFPHDAAVVGPEESLWGGAGVPCAWLAHVPWR